ncbi:hypothetical protein OG562_44575 [Streptomyces sp. NBC_01275]|uniref:hypothetical protein n=1 Tax=Streptomyces sp. NBC_01275 TaxID=2903807 RepID=UPI002254C053|nr:hypothetical protein [Streptomyces sp. NBC_01275]MCX4767898.1 hypothetical protein [Streptomyces sp. NBC_01275]
MSTNASAASVTAETVVVDAAVVAVADSAGSRDVGADCWDDEGWSWTDAAFAVAYNVPRSTVVAAAQATMVFLRLPCNLR